MKNLKLSFTLLLCLFSLHVFSCENCEIFESEESIKVYVELEELVFDSNHIYFIENEGISPVRAVYADTKGLYIKSYNAKAQHRNPRSEDFIRPLKPEERQKYKYQCLNKHEIYCYECMGCAHILCHFR